VAVGLNKRCRPSRERDEDHHQGVEDNYHQKKARRTTMLLMEYIAQDVARSNEDMACNDKVLSDFLRTGLPPSTLVPIISLW
jgi:hypothetical protein